MNAKFGQRDGHGTLRNGHEKVIDTLFAKSVGTLIQGDLLHFTLGPHLSLVANPTSRENCHCYKEALRFLIKYSSCLCFKPHVAEDAAPPAGSER